MEKPSVSVIVPVYKAESFLSNCINSILNQTYRDLEVILVDDGSPDFSGQICEEYAEKDGRVKVELALCKGKKLYDKRDDMAKRDIQRDIDRTIREKNGR